MTSLFLYGVTPYKDFGFHTVDSELQELPSSSLCQLNLGMPIFSGIPDSLICIPDSKAHDSWFYKEIFPGFRIPYMGDRKKCQGSDFQGKYLNRIYTFIRRAYRFGYTVKPL